MTTDWALRPTTTCPGVLEGERAGWYLLAANSRVEVGPFATEADAERAADWLDEQGLGTYPAPWSPMYSPRGLLVGSRWRPARRTGQVPV